MNAALRSKRCQATLAVMLVAGFVFLAPDRVRAEDGQWQINGFVDGAKILREGSPFWQLASSNSTVPTGSNVTLPGGAELARADVGAIAARSLARFELPPVQDGRRLSHIQGNVRYDIARRFDVLTPQLVLSTGRALFDVEVDVHGTQIDAIDGWIKVTSTDRVSEVRLQPGDSARISSTNLGRLQIRRSGAASFITADFGSGRDSSGDDGARAEAEGGADSEGRSEPSSRSDNAGAANAGGAADTGGGGNESDNSNGGGGNAGGSGNDGGGGKGGDDNGKSGGKGKGGGSGKGGGKGKDGGKGKGGGKGKK